MHVMTVSVAALAVASIYYIWKAYFQLNCQRERTLRERVAYMLWVVAQQVE
jgi:hypothetical protein